jgi:Recombination endonuclease VII
VDSKEYSKQYRETHKEEIRACMREYYRTHIDEKKKYNKQYRLENREKLAAQRKAYGIKHSDRLKAYYKKWRKEHPDYSPSYNRQYWVDNKAELTAKGAEWQKAHHELVKAYAQKCYQKSNKDKHIRKRLKRLYGITPEQKQELLESQGSKCGACGSINAGPKGWTLDHDHVTGFIRGVLCHGCNTSLGLLGDSVDRLKALIGYLQFKPDYNFEVL